MTMIRLTPMRAGKTRLLWRVVGHSDGEKCDICGAVFTEWREKVRKQHGATQAECCKGFIIGGRDSSGKD